MTGVFQEAIHERLTTHVKRSRPSIRLANRTRCPSPTRSQQVGPPGRLYSEELCKISWNGLGMQRRSPLATEPGGVVFVDHSCKIESRLASQPFVCVVSTDGSLNSNPA